MSRSRPHSYLGRWTGRARVHWEVVEVDRARRSGLDQHVLSPHDVLAVGGEPLSPGSCPAGRVLTPDEVQVLAGEHAARERPLGQTFQGLVADQVGKAGVG
jgi:hypothetical protein